MFQMNQCRICIQIFLWNTVLWWYQYILVSSFFHYQAACPDPISHPATWYSSHCETIPSSNLRHSSRQFRFPMQQPDIVNFSVFISVAILYMDSAQPEPRVRVFETIIAALKLLLETCGRPQFLKAAFDTWASMSNSLVVLEDSLSWPTTWNMHLARDAAAPPAPGCPPGPAAARTSRKIWPCNPSAEWISGLVQGPLWPRAAQWHLPHAARHHALATVMPDSCGPCTWRSSYSADSCCLASWVCSPWYCRPTDWSKSAVHGAFAQWILRPWSQDAKFSDCPTREKWCKMFLKFFLMGRTMWRFCSSPFAGNGCMARWTAGKTMEWRFLIFLQQWRDHTSPSQLSKKEWRANLTFTAFHVACVSFMWFGFHLVLFVTWKYWRRGDRAYDLTPSIVCGRAYFDVERLWMDRS